MKKRFLVYFAAMILFAGILAPSTIRACQVHGCNDAIIVHSTMCLSGGYTISVVDRGGAITLELEPSLKREFGDWGYAASRIPFIEYGIWNPPPGGFGAFLYKANATFVDNICTWEGNPITGNAYAIDYRTDIVARQLPVGGNMLVDPMAVKPLISYYNEILEQRGLHIDSHGKSTLVPEPCHDKCSFAVSQVPLTPTLWGSGPRDHLSVEFEWYDQEVGEGLKKVDPKLAKESKLARAGGILQSDAGQWCLASGGMLARDPADKKLLACYGPELKTAKIPMIDGKTAYAAMGCWISGGAVSSKRIEGKGKSKAAWVCSLPKKEALKPRENKVFKGVRFAFPY